MLDPGLILDGVEDFVDQESEQSELLYWLVGSERLSERIMSTCFLTGRLPGF